MQKSKNILFLMSGSIAAYKAVQVISRLVQKNFDVHVAASAAALRFVGKATLEGLSGNSVSTDLFEEGHAMDHIHLIRKADLVLLAPASANTINKMAQGVGDDLITTLFLAHDFKKPFLIAPAMNTSMYNHPTTQSSIKKLKDMGLEILESASGVLACGEVGYGKLLEPDLILSEILKKSDDSKIQNDDSVTLKNAPSKTNSALKILVTAGGTSEKIDAVRRITNTSTGQTGFEIAKVMHELGCNVDLLLAESSHFKTSALSALSSVSFFSDHQSLDHALKEKLKQDFDAIIHCAAVSDYTVDAVLDSDGHEITSNLKISSAQDEIHLKLKKTKKIIDWIKSYSVSKKLLVVGFKLTSGSTIDESNLKIKKLIESSNCDLVIHNDITNWHSTDRQYHLHGPLIDMHPQHRGRQKNQPDDKSHKDTNESRLDSLSKLEMIHTLSQILFDNISSHSTADQDFSRKDIL